MESVKGFTAWIETNHGWLLGLDALEIGIAEGYAWESNADVENHLERLLNDFMELELKVGQKVQYGSGRYIIIGTVREVLAPAAPYFITWVSLKDIVKKNGEPSKKYKNGARVNADSVKAYE